MPEMSTYSKRTMENHPKISCCRSCLKDNIEMVSLLDEPINSAFLECTSIQVCQDEALSTLICLTCVEQCKAAKSFREQAIASDEKLRFVIEADSLEEVTIAAESPISMNQEDNIPAEEEPEAVFETVVEKVEEEDQQTEELFLEEVVVECEEVSEEVDEDEEVVVEDEEVVVGDEEEEEDLYMSDDVEEYEQIVYEMTGLDESFGDSAVKTTKPSSKKKVSQVLDCEFCGEQLTNRMKMTRHYIDEHPGQHYTCGSCDRKFMSAHTWRTHTCSIDPFRCEICGKCYTKKGSYLAHRKAHTEGVTRYVCKHCGQGFVNKFYYKMHVERHDGTYRVFECEICGKQFTEHAGMRRHHQLKHTDERPHKCTLCPKRFAFDYMLKRHMQVHTGVRPFKCTFGRCGATLSSQSALTHHMYTHTGEKPYNCEKCDATFRIKMKLRQHMLKSHSKNEITYKLSK